MRSISVLLQRGFDNAVANWPLMLIGIATQVAMILLFIALLVAVLIPGVIIGISIDFGDFEANPASFFEEIILAHPFFIIYVLLGIGVILIPVMMVFSFAEGAKFGVLRDGERARGEGGARSAMRMFDPSQWFAWGRRTWWPAFWIYNIIWGVALGVLLAVGLVFAVIAVAMAVGGGEAGAGGAAAIGCLAVIVLVPIMILAAVLTNMVSQIAMSLLVRDGEGAVATIRNAMSFIRRHPGYSIGVTLITLVVAFAVGGAFGGIGVIINMGGEMNESLLLMMLPIQIIFTLIQSAVTIAVQTWVSAVFVSMVDGERSVAVPSPASPVTAL